MPTQRTYGPQKPSKLALMGIRFIDGEDGNAPPAPAAPAPATPPEPVEPPEDKTDWKAEARKWESRSKENSTAAQRLADIEESQKTAAQKLEDRVTAAEKLAATSSTDALRARVALEKGLTPNQEKRLVGSTREELLADADELLTDLGSQKAPAPKPDPSIGPKAPAAPRGLSAAVKAHYDTA